VGGGAEGAFKMKRDEGGGGGRKIRNFRQGSENDPQTETARWYCAKFVLKSTQKDQNR
jgi:hypothetical protein